MDRVGRERIKVGEQMGTGGKVGSPVDAGGLGFVIRGVAAAGGAGEAAELFLNPRISTDAGLVMDFGLDEFLPEAFFSGEGGFELAAHSFLKQVVALERGGYGGGKVIGIAENHKSSGFQHRQNGGAGEGGVGGIDEKKGTVFGRELSRQKFVAEHEDLAMTYTECGIKTRDLDYSTTHDFVYLLFT